MSYDDDGGGYNIRVIDWRLRDLQKIYTPEEQEERAAKALELNGFTAVAMPQTEETKLKAASKTKPTVRVNKAKKESLVDQLLRQQRQAKLKAAASPHQIVVPPPPSSSPISSVKIAAALPTHEITPDMVEPIADNQTELIAKTTCLGCGANATQVLRFELGKQIPEYCRPTANPKILRGYCQVCKGDLLARYSGSALQWL
jgi:hypothetical protein